MSAIRDTCIIYPSGWVDVGKVSIDALWNLRLVDTCQELHLHTIGAGQESAEPLPPVYAIFTPAFSDVAVAATRPLPPPFAELLIHTPAAILKSDPQGSFTCVSPDEWEGLYAAEGEALSYIAPTIPSAAETNSSRQVAPTESDTVSGKGSSDDALMRDDAETSACSDVSQKDDIHVDSSDNESGSMRPAHS